MEHLFKAYFEDGRFIGDPAVLTAVASEAGMDAALVSELLAQDADKDIVEREDTLAHEMGISGVPTFIFENKYMISGAREPEILVRVIDKAIELSKAESA